MAKERSFWFGIKATPGKVNMWNSTGLFRVFQSKRKLGALCKQSHKIIILTQTSAFGHLFLVGSGGPSLDVLVWRELWPTPGDHIIARCYFRGILFRFSHWILSAYLPKYQRFLWAAGDFFVNKANFGPEKLNLKHKKRNLTTLLHPEGGGWIRHFTPPWKWKSPAPCTPSYLIYEGMAERRGEGHNVQSGKWLKTALIMQQWP